MALEYAFELASSSIRFGPGVTREIGMDLAEMNAKRVMVLTDPNLAKLSPVATVLESLRDNRISSSLFDRVHVEPTDVSFREAIDFATRGDFDALVAVGGGSTIDTAKAANLYSTYPADFLDYVNAPIGKGKPVPGPLKPLIAVPTTAGTGSETTGVAIFDYTPLHAKTGDRKSTRLNSSHSSISYAVFCLKKKKACLSGRSLVLASIGGGRAYETRDMAIIATALACHSASASLRCDHP